MIKTVSFGEYEQDGNVLNGKEPIEWIVLDEQDDKKLVISKYGLEYPRYNEEYTAVTWETCSLRTWLNKTFLNAAFSEEEQAGILWTTVTPDENPDYSTFAGNATYDRVFLLSIDEVNRYFSSDYAKRGKATNSAKNGESGTKKCRWWLRTPGHDSTYVAVVEFDGTLEKSGHVVNNSIVAVRPAMWIDSNSTD